MVMRQAEQAITAMATVTQCINMTKLIKVSHHNYLPDLLNTIITFIIQKKKTDLGVFKTAIWLKNPTTFSPLG